MRLHLFYNSFSNVLRAITYNLKGLGSLNINFGPANFEKSHFTKSFKILQCFQNITYFP